MPIYEYKCKSCGYQFEMRQSFSSSAIMRCPECDGKTGRVISPPSFYMASKMHPQDPTLHKSEKHGCWVKEGTEID